jgi:hypothetical protein
VHIDLANGPDGTRLTLPVIQVVTEVTVLGTCGGIGEFLSPKFGFQMGMSSRTDDPLVDEDPDGAHLVGTTTWTLADPPYELVQPVLDYNVTATYDLWRGPAPTP